MSMFPCESFKLEVLFSSSITGPVKDVLFLQTAKGQAVLQQAKDFMRQYVFPIQEVSARRELLAQMAFSFEKL